MSNVDEILEAMKRVRSSESDLRDAGHRVYHKREKKFRPSRPDDNPDDVIHVDQADLGWGGETFLVGPDGDCVTAADVDGGEESLSSRPVVVVPAQLLERARGASEALRFAATCWDCGDAYRIGDVAPRPESDGSTAELRRADEDFTLDRFEAGDARVLVTLAVPPPSNATGPVGGASAYVCGPRGWELADLQIIPDEKGLFSRHDGILESPKLADCEVAVIGVGTVGSGVAMGLVQSGTRKIALQDPDRLEAGNVCRHACSLEHLGRFKTKALADVLRNKNPYCEVTTVEQEVRFDTMAVTRDLVRRAHLVVCGLDSHRGRLIVNQLCLEEGKACLYPGLRRRAHGGQILFCRPYETPCYVCHVKSSPGLVQDREIASCRQAGALAYTDLAVPVEPGLEIDVAPIVIMTTKLAIQYLLRGKESSLHSLDDDLIAPFYVWFNRREVGTPAEKLDPMAFNVDTMTVLRWYGIPKARVPRCPCCGDEPRLHFDSGGAEADGLRDGEG